MTAKISKLIPIALALAAIAPAAATATIHNPQSDAAMRKAIRDFALDGVRGKTVKATQIHVDCVQAAQVSSTRPCSGTFSLTLAGKTARYKLTNKASTFRNSPGSMMYHLRATATTKAAGLPSKIKFDGFLQ